MSAEDAELEALLLDAQVKEDYLDLGLMEPEELNASRATGRGTVERLGEEVRAMKSTSTGKKYKVKSVKGQAGLLMYYSFTVDADLGEMFLNFPMDPAIRPHAGVELTGLRNHLKNRPGKGRIIERWERLFMGMRPLPYISVCYFYWAEEFARGDPREEGNALRYDRVVLNLPGMLDFDPSKPNVMKWNDHANKLAGGIITFVDGLRASGFDRENAWQVARQIVSRLQYLGIQDAARKRRPSSQTGGAWAGTILEIAMSSIFKTVSQEKWDKGKVIILSLVAECKDPHNPPNLCHKTLEKKRGFLVHLGMTFPNIIPFLKRPPLDDRLVETLSSR
jgi:hypothetical protein